MKQWYALYVLLCSYNKRWLIIIWQRDGISIYWYRWCIFRYQYHCCNIYCKQNVFLLSRRRTYHWYYKCHISGEKFVIFWVTWISTFSKVMVMHLLQIIWYHVFVWHISSYSLINSSNWNISSIEWSRLDKQFWKKISAQTGYIVNIHVGSLWHISYH